MPLSSVLSRIPFIGGYEAGRQQDMERSAQMQNQDIGRMGLLQKMQAMEQQKQQMEQQKLLQTAVQQAGGDPNRAMQALLSNGTPQAIELATKLKALMPKPPEDRVVGAGGALVNPAGVVKYQAPFAPAKETVDPLERAMAKRDAIPEGDPQRPIWDNYIRKLSETAKQISPTVVMPGGGLHFTNTVSDDGTVRVHAFDKQGNLVKTTEPGGKTPSFLSNENMRERQLSTALEAVKKPHLEVLNAYQRYEQIKGTGDNAQANQFLAQQLMQMSKTGQRVIPKAELERILGSGDLGNDWIGRSANMVTQMAAGVRTPTIDKRLNDLADAMAKGSADRIGQEIQNTRARTPPGVDATRIVGATPTIYGRFIITPTGKVHTFKSSAEAQAKLQEASQVVGK